MTTLMRVPLFLFAAFTGLSASAQCSEHSLGFSSSDHVDWMKGDLRADGSVVAVLAPRDPLGDMLIVRIDAAGTTTWSKRFATTDPGVYLEPEQVLNTPDGGATVFGYRVCRESGLQSAEIYENYFILHVDAAGEQAWAAIYMRENGEFQYNDGMRESSIGTLPDGGYLLFLNRGDGPLAVRLAADGTVQWSKQYQLDPAVTFDPQLGAFTTTADGSSYFSMFSPDGMFILHTDANGAVLWGRRSDVTDIPTAVFCTADGDVIINGYSSLDQERFALRMDATGTVEWHNTYTHVSSNNDVAELSTGDLLFGIDGGGSGFIARLDASGTETDYWRLDDAIAMDIIGVQDDALVLGFSELATLEPRVVRMEDVADITCIASSDAVGTQEPATAVISAVDVLTTDVLVKRWSMSFGPAVEMGLLDLEPTLASGASRPGFPMTYYGGVMNLAGATSGEMEVVLTVDPMLVFGSATPTPSSVVPGMVTWTGLPGVGSFDVTQMSAQFTVPTGTLGQVLVATLAVTQDSVETTLDNNLIERSQMITGSYDPNDKLVWPRDLYLIDTDSVLDYTIRFQNTGTDTAFTVVVRDTLPADLDATTFRPGAASHPYTYSLTANGLLEFRFDNILLPDSNTNEPLSHGLINFHIDPIWPVVLGQTITNRADIFFDFNEPVRTPDAVVTVATPTGMRTTEAPERLMVFPVPTKDQLTAVLPADFVPVNGYALATDGRRMPLALPTARNGRVTMDVRLLPPGYYVLSLFDAKGRRSATRFVKE